MLQPQPVVVCMFAPFLSPQPAARVQLSTRRSVRSRCSGRLGRRPTQAAQARDAELVQREADAAFACS